MWTISKALRRSIFSQDPGEEFSADYYLDGGQSAPSSSTSTAGRSSCPAKTTGVLSRSRYGMTFARSTDGLGEAAVMLCAGASPARTAARLEEEQASTERSQGCGRRCHASSGKSGQRGFSPRTRRDYSGSGSTSSYETLTRSGMMRNGVVSPLPSLAPPTSGTGFGFLGEPGKPLTEEERLYLFAQIDAQDVQSHIVLPAKTFEYLPTPTYSDAKNCGSVSQLKRAYVPLSCRVRMTTDEENGVTVFNRVRRGRTNPRFLAWMMGFPSRWSSLGGMGTLRFLSWLHAHSSILRRGSEWRKGR